MRLVAVLLAFLVSGSTLALAPGGGNALLRGPFPSSMAVGGMPDPNGPFDPSGVGVPGGAGPGNTTIMPNMTPPPVNR
jgi:hypothetical protein